MRILGRALAALLPAAVLGPLACSLLVDTDGLSGDLETADATEDALADAPVPDASKGDEAATDHGCLPALHVDAPFTAELGPWVPHSFPTSLGYPRLEPFDDAAVAAVFLPVRPQAEELFSSRSSLWLSSVVPLVALDVAVDVDIRCTAANSCADGVAVIWLGTNDPTVLDGPAIGGTAFPLDIPGAGVVLDNYKNEGDPAPPSLQVLELGRPGASETDSRVAASIPAAFAGAVHHLDIRLRGTRVTVTYDGAATFSGKVGSVASGLFGFVAGTGGQTDAVAIRNLQASFYDCTP